MAFPFGPQPKLSDFIKNAVENYGAEIVEMDFSIRGPSDESTPKILERKENGAVFHVPVPDGPDDQPISWYKIRQMCDRLNIPTMDYDFELTDEGLKPREK